jgi:adenylylsulfate kinase-like enzyme
VRPARLTLLGTRTSTIAALIEAELKARGQRLDVLELVPRTHLFGGEQPVEVHLDVPTGRPDLVIDTDKENAAEAAEKVLAFLDGHALGVT